MRVYVRTDNEAELPQAVATINEYQTLLTVGEALRLWSDLNRTADPGMIRATEIVIKMEDPRS